MVDRPEAKRRWVRGLPMPPHLAVWSGAVVLAACLVWANPASGKLFSYTQIADTTPAYMDYFYPQPAINGHGSVAFFAADFDYPSEGPSIYVGTGGAPAGIVADSSGAFGALIPHMGLSINDGGNVAFTGTTEWLGQELSAVVRYDSPGYYTTIASASFPAGPLLRVCCPSINNAGATAFGGYVLTSPTTVDEFIMIGTGDPPGYSASAEGLGFEHLYAPSVRRHSAQYEVAFAAAVTDSPSYRYRAAVYKVTGTGTWVVLTTIAETSDLEFTRIGSGVSLDDLGRVAFVATLASGDRGVFMGKGGPVLTFADSTGAYASFGAVASSVIGAAFNAELDSGDQGVYAGSDPVADRVIQIGDSLPGYPSKVSWVTMGLEGYNNVGQVAMAVSFEDGSQRVIRADPLAFFVPEEAALADLAVAFLSKEWSYAQQMVPTPPQAAALTLDYLFITTEGTLDVLVNDVVVASVPAPSAIAHDFTALEILIDPGALFPAPPDELSIAIRLRSEGMETGLLVDNVRFPGIVDGDFQTGTLDQWQTGATGGGAVGLAVAPPGGYPVPEPGATACLAMAAAALGGYLRRRRKA